MSQSTPDLRARMQRVATKPHRRIPPAVQPSLPVLEHERVTGPRTVPRRKPARRIARVPFAKRARIRTLLAWGKWEVMAVPARRWRWLTAVLRGGGARPRS
jgi:hypothetical protein